MRRSMRGLIVTMMVVAASTAGAADFSRVPCRVDPGMRYFVARGISEGELFARLGPADRQSVQMSPAGDMVVEYVYFPCAQDPLNLTIVWARGGVVIDFRREIAP